MKSGSGTDPFADESNADATTDDSGPSDAHETTSSVDSPVGPDEDTEQTASDSPAFDGSSPSAEQLPYIFARDGVKDNRSVVQYFLRQDTQQIEKEALSAVGEELGTDVYLTDLREALIRVGAKHIDEVTNELRSWGYNLKE